jgi:hypothetical protein
MLPHDGRCPCATLPRVEATERHIVRYVWTSTITPSRQGALKSPPRSGSPSLLGLLHGRARLVGGLVGVGGRGLHRGSLHRDVVEVGTSGADRTGSARRDIMARGAEQTQHSAAEGLADHSAHRSDGGLSPRSRMKTWNAAGTASG